MFLVVSVSMLLLFAVAVAVLIRYAGLKAWQAIVCVLFGFFLASSEFAPYIRDGLAQFFGATPSK